jgi:hypothetical protein
MKDKVTNYFKRLIANFEFARCVKQAANDMKFHCNAKFRSAQFVSFILYIIDERLTTPKQQKHKLVP